MATEMEITLLTDIVMNLPYVYSLGIRSEFSCINKTTRQGN